MTAKKNPKKNCCKIHLVDRFLIILMIILCVQSFLSVIFYRTNSSISDRTDIVIRTALASIFGYFISANFITHRHDEKTENTSQSKVQAEPINIPSQENSAEPKLTNKIGFDTYTSSTEDSSPTNVRGNIKTEDLYDEEKDAQFASQSQIFIVGCLSIFSVLFIIFVRYFGADNNFSLAAVFQFRDIVCGCIGFLIGMPTTKKSN